PFDRPYQERHGRVTIAAVIEGIFTYHGDHGRSVLHPGVLLLGNAGGCYECGHDHGVGDRCISIQIAPEYFADAAASVTGSSRFKFSTGALPANRKMIPWLTWIATRSGTASAAEIDEALPALLDAVIGATSGATPATAFPLGRDERRISAVLRHIEGNADETLSLDTLVGMAAMSKYHFMRRFQRVVGATPHQHLLNIRIRRAAMRLTTTAAPVSSIAFEAGFGDLSTFNRRFRQIFGASPTVFRQRERSR
ncbi:MAG: helix-turn-helix transcriptional regulator, partial [Alphaproteobacteria bacterium]|nr:helix-turn-helix transcriptional regulator [Alphaproteobacteria bacterium]